MLNASTKFLTFAATGAEFEAFNILGSLIKRATGPKVEGDDISGTLKADSSARGIFLSLRGKITKESTSPSGTITHFNSIGVSFDREGVLQFDESKLTAAMQSAPQDVIKALSNNRLSPSTVAQRDRAARARRLFRDLPSKR